MERIKQSTWELLQAMARHPHAGLTAEEMVQMCQKQNYPFDNYAAVLDLRLTISDAMEKFRAYDKAAGSNLLQSLRRVAVASAGAVCTLTVEEPLPGEDVAGAVARDLTSYFLNMLAGGIGWEQPPAPPKRPTNDAPSTRH